MQRFFLSLCELSHFAYSSARLSSQESCAGCQQHQYWVPHGFVYKKRSSKKHHVVGRRLFCSYRHGRRGCGHTRQLYLSQIIPRHQYPLSTIVKFISFLFNGLSISNAYQKAVGKHLEARQAYRWLTPLYQQLGDFRTQLEKRERDQKIAAHYSSHRLRILLPTLWAWLQPESLAVQYRLQYALL